MIRYIMATMFTAMLITAATAAERTEPYVLGADISWVQQQENNGVRYYHNGAQVDPFEVLKEHGFNYIRLRLFVDPTAKVTDEAESPYSSANQNGNSADALKPYCGLDSTIKMAKRAKAAGMKFLLDFHYSDTWTDPGKQHTPMSWRHITTLDDLAEKVRSYTKESLEAFRDADALPDMVQVGNESVGGMLWPMGKSWGCGSNDRTCEANFAKLVNAGIDGVKDVSGDIKIMVHTINDENKPTDPIDWWLSFVVNHVSRIDVFGISHYEEDHGAPSVLQSTVNAFIANSKFNDIKFCVAEHADNHRAVNDIVFNIPNNRGFGTFVWEPFNWRESLFDWRSGTNAGRHSNDRLLLYPQMSAAYGNDDFDGGGDDNPSAVRRNASASAAPLVKVSGQTLRLHLPQSGAVNIFNINGKRVRTIKLTSGTHTINASGLPKGIYIIKTTSGASYNHTVRMAVK